MARKDTIPLDTFKVICGFEGWEFFDEIRVVLPTKKQRAQEPSRRWLEVSRTSTFASGETLGMTSFAIRHKKLITFDAINPLDTLTVNEFGTPKKRWSLLNLRVPANKAGQTDRFCSPLTLEKFFPPEFSEIDINALLDSMAFGESEIPPKPENNQLLHKLIENSKLSRREIAALTGIPLDSLHNYLAKPHHGKFRGCPDLALEAVKKAVG